MQPGLAASAALMVVMSFVTASAMPAQDEQQWTWVRLEPRPRGEGWNVRQGHALVHVDRASGFHAELDVDAADLRQHYRLDGSVRRGRVEATEVLLNSDASPRRYGGEVDEPNVLSSPPHGACLHLHSGEHAIHLCQDGQP